MDASRRSSCGGSLCRVPYLSAAPAAILAYDARVLPTGVSVLPLTPHADERGIFTELYRASWEPGVAPVQWNAVRSEANVLRGVHAHLRHTDYLTLALGRATIGLHDLRGGSPTEGLGTTVKLDAGKPAALVIPVGVAHGFYFHESSLHIYAVSHEFDPRTRSDAAGMTPRSASPGRARRR